MLRDLLGMICRWLICCMLALFLSVSVDAAISSMLVIVAASEKSKSILSIEGFKGNMLKQKASICALTEKCYVLIDGQNGNKLSINFLWLKAPKEV